MKTKSLFVTLLLTLFCTISWAATVTETITPASFMAAGGVLTDGSSTSFSNVSIGYPNIKYAGNVGYSATYGAFYFNSSLNFSVTSSKYNIKSVSVTFATGASMSARNNDVTIYFNNSAFNGSETNAALKTALGQTSLTYTAKGQSKSPDADSKFFALSSSKIVNTYVTQIKIELEELSVFDVTIGTHSHGTILINGVGANAEIEVGASVTLSFIPDDGYELISYTIGGVTTNLSEAEKTGEAYSLDPFDMPSEDVEVSAVFNVAEHRVVSVITVAYDDVDWESVPFDVPNYPLELNVAEENEFVWYVTVGGADYNGSISNLSYSWANGGIAEVSTWTYDPEIVTGVLAIRGLAMGTDALTINFAQTNEYQATSITLYVKVVVPTHTAALVAEVDGRYYAVTKTLSIGKLSAEEVLVVNNKVFYDASTVTATDLSWVIATTTNALGDPAYAIQKESNGKYLSRSGNSFLYVDDLQLWDDAQGKPSLGSRYIGYVAGNFEVSTTASIGAYEIATLDELKEYSRTQPNGKYSTICLPYPINVESPFVDGVGTVYEVSGVYKSGSTVTGIALDEFTGPVLEAGTPYIFEATTDELYILYGEKTTAATRGYATGLVGNLESTKLSVPDDGDCYGISNNQIRRVLPGAIASVGQYKAYIDVTDLPAAGAASAPGRRVMYAYNQEDAATSLEDFLNNATLINWNEPVYNMLGQQVGKGTTGVLIQNGQKFFVH